MSDKNAYASSAMAAIACVFGLMAAVAFVGAFLHDTAPMEARRVAIQEEFEECRSDNQRYGCQSAYASIRSANAADDIVDIAIWQFYAGLAGIVFVGATLKFTRDAVREAGNNAKIAADLFGHERDSTQRALRPYVFIETMNSPAWIGADHTGRGRWRFEFVWKNTGQTPAMDITHSITAYRFDGQMPKNFDFPEAKPVDGGSLGPDQRLVTSIEVGVKDIARAKTMKADTLHIFMSCEYSDGFPGTKRRRTERTVRIYPRREGRGPVNFRDEVQPGFNGSDGNSRHKPKPRE